MLLLTADIKPFLKIYDSWGESVLEVVVRSLKIFINEQTNNNGWKINRYQLLTANISWHPFGVEQVTLWLLMFVSKSFLQPPLPDRNTNFSKVFTWFKAWAKLRQIFIFLGLLLCLIFLLCIDYSQKLSHSPNPIQISPELP